MGFKLDAHIHCPIEKLDAALSHAIAKGLDGVVFTEHDSDAPFCTIKRFGLNGWDVQETKDPRVLRLDLLRDDLKGRIYLGRGREVKSKQGHILALGTSSLIPTRYSWEDTLKYIYDQDGIPVFAHLFGRFSGGCGRNVFMAALDKFDGKVIGLEENAQYFGSANHKSRALANVFGVPLLGNSDAHGRYGEHYLEIGKLHSEIEVVNGETLFDDLKRVMLTNPKSIKVCGEYNTFGQTSSWWVDSLRKNGMSKVFGSAYEAVKGLIK